MSDYLPCGHHISCIPPGSKTCGWCQDVETIEQLKRTLDIAIGEVERLEAAGLEMMARISRIEEEARKEVKP